MQQRPLGRSGLHVSALAFGGMTFGGTGRYAGLGDLDVTRARRLLDQSLAAGVTLIDTADAYSAGLAEEVLGEALEGRRDRVVLATKVGQPMGEGPDRRGSGRAHLLRSCDDSLRRLRTDRIDLYQLHVWDGQTPLEETLGALDELVRAGKVLHVGCSNFSAWHLARALAISERDGLPRMAAHQVHYSLLGREIEYELVPLALDQAVGTVVWSPLAGGVLAGRRPDAAAPAGTRQADFGDMVPIDVARANLIIDALDELARELAATPAAVAVAWLLAKPWVSTVILGARTPEQLAATLAAAELALPPEAEQRLDELSAPPLIYPYWHQRRMARLGEAEAPMLRGSRDTLRRLSEGTLPPPAPR
jgi:aryl-alcohol dehydrogenase-like predicted oxidoreductase